jgi:hypothetical protein
MALLQEAAVASRMRDRGATPVASQSSFSRSVVHWNVGGLVGFIALEVNLLKNQELRRATVP